MCSAVRPSNQTTLVWLCIKQLLEKTFSYFASSSAPVNSFRLLLCYCTGRSSLRRSQCESSAFHYKIEELVGREGNIVKQGVRDEDWILGEKLEKKKYICLETRVEDGKVDKTVEWEDRTETWRGWRRRVSEGDEGRNVKREKESQWQMQGLVNFQLS